MSIIGTVNILGTEYVIKEETEDTNRKLENNDGLCESFSKELILDLSYRNNKMAYKKIDDYFHEVLRHECFHALFHESGHHEYACDEMLVNTLALLYPKIKAIMDSVDKIKL